MRIKAKKRSGIIIHNVRYSDVRAGLSWPTAVSPGYYCILGEEYHEKTRYEGSDHKGKLKLLSEREFSGISLNELFAKLTDDTSLLHCSRIFTDMSDEYLGCIEAFRDFTLDIRSGGYISEAPYADNFMLGVSWIQDWTRTARLDIPEKSVIRSQLKRITKADLADSPETRFYAINALRFVVGAFHKIRPRSESGFRPNRKSKRF